MVGLDDMNIWRRTSRCESASCVEVAFGEHEVYVRNSRDPDRTLAFTTEEWIAFCAGVRAGELQG
jgi:hypothetical protein